MPATFAPVALIRSAGAISICRPRRPAQQNIAASSSAEASMTMGSRRFCPTGEIPPTTYPVARSAAAASAMIAFLPPTAAASALRSR
jgi:hypothetical protein